MTNGEAINWIINLSADIGKAEHSDLWHYEQALSEIREMLESAEPEDTIEMQESDIDEAFKRLRDARVTILPSAKPELATNLQPTCNQFATDTIFRQAAIDALKIAELGCEVEAIEALPSAEPVRCKDCFHYTLMPNGCNGQCDLQYTQVMYPWDFCSYGERRQDATG